jgi:hypothetical protein
MPISMGGISDGLGYLSSMNSNNNSNNINNNINNINNNLNYNMQNLSGMFVSPQPPQLPSPPQQQQQNQNQNLHQINKQTIQHQPNQTLNLQAHNNLQE